MKSWTWSGNITPWRRSPKYLSFFNLGRETHGVAVQFASAGGLESARARKRFEQPRRMAVAGKKLSIRLCASRWHTGMGSNLIYGLSVDWIGLDLPCRLHHTGWCPQVDDFAVRDVLKKGYRPTLGVIAHWLVLSIAAIISTFCVRKNQDEPELCISGWQFISDERDSRLHVHLDW